MPRPGVPPTASTSCCGARCTCSSTSCPYVTLLLRVRGNTEVERRALARRRAFDKTVTALVSEAQAEGSLRSDIDASVVSRLAFGMINSIVEWYRPGGREDADRLADDVVAVVLDGLRMPTSNRVQQLLG